MKANKKNSPDRLKQATREWVEAIFDALRRSLDDKADEDAEQRCLEMEAAFD